MLDVEAMQDHWSRTRDRESRRQAGQFFTPRWIARGMAHWVLGARPTHIVDPAFGFGILADECLRQGYQGRLTGHEIDPSVVASWHEATIGQSPIRLIEGDFFSSMPSEIEAAIANPPYNRFQNRDLSPAVRALLQDVLGESANGYTNQYAVFMYMVISRLADHGRAAFIVPSEFLATGYGIQVKNFLIRSRRLQHLVLFDTAERVFADASTTACVLLFGCAQQSQLSIWHLRGSDEASRLMSVCGSPSDISPDAVMPYSTLDATLNWQSLGREDGDIADLVPLGTFGQTKRGIATGANDFFVLTQSEAEQRHLDIAHLRPCIASADSALRPIFDTNDWEFLRDSGRAAYLFDGMAASSPTSSRHAQNYVAHGELQGYHLRYLTKMRRPWYRLEQRPVASLLLAVFGRGGFRAVLNRSNAINLTAFHAFYAHAEFPNATGLLWLYLQTPLAHRAFARQQRAYGDGLKKLEPGDWNKLLVPDWRQWSPSALAQAAQLIQAAQAAGRVDATPQWESAVDAFGALVEKFRNRLAQPQATPAQPAQPLLI